MNDRTARLSGYAKCIATELHKLDSLHPWTFVEPTEDTWSVYLRNAGNARIYVQFVGYADNPERMEVSGNLNIGKNRQYVQLYENGNRVGVPTITVAVSRGCAAIAKDISKRFLPEYMRLFTMAETKVREEAKAKADIHANLQGLASAVGKSIPIDEASGFNFSFGVSGVYGNVAAFADDASLNIKNLTYAQAAHILKYLRKA